MTAAQRGIFDFPVWDPLFGAGFVVRLFLPLHEF